MLIRKDIEHFTSNPVYRRVFCEMEKKYNSYGEAKGFVTIKDATDEECELLNGIITSKSYKPPYVRFKPADFEKGLLNTTVGTSLKELLSVYFNREIISNTENRNEQARKKQAFINTLRDEYIDTPCVRWLEAVMHEKSHGYNTVFSLFDESPHNAKTVVSSVCRALNNLCADKASRIKYLAVFSAGITNNSHYFDKVTSFTAVIGLRLYDEKGEEHPAYKCFFEKGCEIDDAREFTKLQGIVDNELKRIASSMIETRKKCFQELSMKKLKSDIIALS